ncbi:MAG: FAD:protein FMN transferase [Clostridia bacterium]|nr:FAD:protein FMN transferase [Clostridia bacterium]
MKQFFKENYKVIICVCILLGLLAIFLAVSPKSPQGQPSQDGLKAGTGVVNYALFDTVSYIYTYAGDTSETFDANCEEVWSILAEYHQLFDIYHEYSGINNLCTLNKNAGGDALEVSPKLIDFLLYAKELYVLTNGEMNIMMGAVLSLWHDAREAGNYIPSNEALEEASEHISFDCLEIDEVNNTVRITDKDARIDVGALGKGYATELAARHLEGKGVKSYVLNIGGNIRIIGTKTDGSGWGTGIKNPENPSTYIKKITISDTSCVTSGDYERYITVGGKKYHHIIDKDTLMPAEYFSSVTIITKNSGLADALSTALFCMSYADGLDLIQSIENVEVLWVFTDGTTEMTEGFEALLMQ